MNEEIGSVAGQVWTYLNTNGPASANKISTDTGLNKTDLQRAIGWLACEDKLDFETKGRTETISLR